MKKLLSALLGLLVSSISYGQTFPLEREVLTENVLYCETLEAAKEAADGYAEEDRKGAEIMFAYAKQEVCHKGSGVVICRALEYEKTGARGTWRVYSFTTRDGAVHYEITDWKGVPKGRLNI